MKRITLTLMLALGLLAPAPAAAQDPEAADRAWREGDTERAAQLYAAILERDSLDGRALHRLALFEAWNERYDASFALFDRLLRAEPDNLDARIDRARVNAWRGRTEVAIADLERLLEEHPNHAPALHALGQFESWAGHFDRALSAYSAAQRLDPTLAVVAHERARVLAWASRFDAATALYDSLLATDPNDARALRGLARIAAWAGDLIEAERGWRAAIAANPEDAEAQAGLAQTLRWQGRDAAALDAARRAVALDPSSTDAHTELREAQAAFRPRASPSFVYENDSDGNRIGTFSASTTHHVLSRLALTGSAYHRSARVAAPVDADNSAFGGGLGARYVVEPGWTIGANLGASSTDVRGDPRLTLSADVSTPRRNPVFGSLAVRHGAFDATSALIVREVTMTELAADATLRAGQRTIVSAGAGTTGFESGVSGDGNRRVSGYVSASRRMRASFVLGATARAFGFDRDLSEGYFDPDRFLHAELLGGYAHALGPLRVSLEAAPGVQQVGSGGDAALVARGAGRVSWPIGDGRELGFAANAANAGLQRLSPTADSDYRYYALSAYLNWAF